MKSPNAKSSMRNLEAAKQLLRSAMDDLKNDPEVRAQSIHTMIREIEYSVDNCVQSLKQLGYP